MNSLIQFFHILRFCEDTLQSSKFAWRHSSLIFFIVLLKSVRGLQNCFRCPRRYNHVIDYADTVSAELTTMLTQCLQSQRLCWLRVLQYSTNCKKRLSVIHTLSFLSSQNCASAKTKNTNQLWTQCPGFESWQLAKYSSENRLPPCSPKTVKQVFKK